MTVEGSLVALGPVVVTQSNVTQFIASSNLGRGLFVNASGQVTSKLGLLLPYPAPPAVNSGQVTSTLVLIWGKEASRTLLP